MEDQVGFQNKYRLFDYAEDIKCFLEMQIGQPCILYGHSLGAQIAIAVTSLAPTYVKATCFGRYSLLLSQHDHERYDLV